MVGCYLVFCVGSQCVDSLLQSSVSLCPCVDLMSKCARGTGGDGGGGGGSSGRTRGGDGGESGGGGGEGGALIVDGRLSEETGGDCSLSHSGDDAGGGLSLIDGERERA